MALNEAALLSLWEQGQARQPLDLALLLLWGCTGLDGAAAAALPLGERERRLLQARMALFGPTLQATADCPHCGNCLAFELPLQELASQLVAAEAGTVVACTSGRYRVPTSADLAQALAHADPRRALAEALCVEARGTLDEAALAEAETALAEADPAAQIDLALQCDACGRSFDAPFDATDCLWSELQRVARDTLDDVHQLASAYGWSEAEVLAVPPARRRHYLQRVQA